MTFYYLMSPYSRFADGIDKAAELAALNAGLLMQHGVNVYSPIAHCHYIARHTGIDPHDHKIWLPANACFLEQACGGILLKMRGWDDSFGIAEELKVLKAAGKPIIPMEPGIVPEVLHVPRQHVGLHSGGVGGSP